MKEIPIAESILAARENASESDTIEHVALCRVIKRNVVTRTNSKR